MLSNFRYLTLLLVLLSSFNLEAQRPPQPEFGVLEYSDYQIEDYPKDPEAPAVVLYERGKNYVKLIDNYVFLIKEVHRKIKVFDASKYEGKTVVIPFFEKKQDKEKVIELKAVTHNGKHLTYLNEYAVYETNETDNWSLKRFTFPNVKDGSILEYTYTIRSPYYAYFDGWQFQDDIPKIYSEFVSEMPGNFVYRKSLVGTEPLDINDVSLKKDCFFLPGHVQNADCELGIYAMHHVPAFQEEEYMLAKDNYMARLDFELKEHIDFRGIKTKYTRDWDDVDKEFRFDKDLGRQLGYRNFFQENIPANILQISDPLEKAKAVFYFIQSHFAWNGRQRILSDIRVKEAFNEKTGNSSEINLALINALEAAGLDARIVLLATRDRAIPTQLYPVMTEFNYAIVHLDINGNSFLLDATDKYNSFGVLPVRALNSIGRKLDFKEGSSWIPIEPYAKNVSNLSAQFKFEGNGLLRGIVKESHMGYSAMEVRAQINQLTQAEYLAKMKNKVYSAEVDINEYSNENLTDLESVFTETYSVEATLDDSGSIVLYPFFLGPFFKENPFKMEARNYPVDFGYPGTYVYSMTMDLNDMYTIDETPENKIVKLPENAGECSVVYSVSGSKLNLRFTLKLRNVLYTSAMYQSLKEFFNQVVLIQNKEAIILNRL